MNKLWDYKDYVIHLSHENRLVRRWVFSALENRFLNRYADQVCSLISDEDEHLACAAPRYLALHEAVQHAPAILESFKSGQGIIPSNCASALAKMYYEPAIDVMLEHFINPGSAETFLGILDYLGKIHREKCRDALKPAVIQTKDTFLLGSAMANLLRHHNPEDVKLVLDKYFESGDRNNRNDMLLNNISSPLGGGSYFRDLTEFGQNNILVKPVETIDGLTLKNSHIKMDEILRENMIMSLENGQYEDFVTMIMFDSRNIVNERYPKNNCPDCLSELFGQDTMCISLLEDLSKRSNVWKQVKHSKELGTKLVSLIISAYFAIKEREAYQKALYPEAGVEELIQAVKNTGSILPMQIQKKIKELSPISELKANLTTDLMTWGDIWTVRIMGQIGNKDFAPELIRVLRNTDSMDYIYSDALRAINTLDESADESILNAIKNQELGDWESFPILEHLPYSEAYDLALHKWEDESDDNMDSYEIFSYCLRGIGDPRGIEKLQDVYANENDATYIGNALECLSMINNVDIPEVPDILKKRIEQEEKQKVREKELNELAYNYKEKKEQGMLENNGKVVPFKRDTPKVGRNAPCPCGSGKKYKKCCLGKQAVPSQTLYYRRLSEAHDRLVDRLLPYATRTFGEEAVDVAMREFLLWPDPEDEIGEDTLDRVGPLFWPWFLFNWESDSFDAGLELPGPEGRTVAELYAEKRGNRLDPLERKLIDNLNRKPYTFWEVLHVDKGKGMRLQDVLKGNRIEIQERSGSEYVQPGDLLYGRAVSVDGVGMLIGLGPTIIPPGRKPDIIQLRKQLRRGLSSITDDTLYEWDVEIREMYLHIDHALHSLPQLCNTNGDPMEFHRLIYEVSSTEEAFEKLCDLCTTVESEELRVDAKRDDTDRIIRVEIPWDRQGHKGSPGMPNTVLGRIVIDGRRLTAEVNSAERAETLRHEIDARLGAGVHFKVDEIQDVDSMMNKHMAGTAARKHSPEHDELMQHPEVQEQLAGMIYKHWENWVDGNIPALGGISPREAIKSPDGREAVEALLKDAERDRGQDPFTTEANRKGTRRVRELLGLND